MCFWLLRYTAMEMGGVDLFPCVVLSLLLQVGVSCRRGGAYFSKRNKGFFQVRP